MARWRNRQRNMRQDTYMVESARVRELLELHGSCQPQHASEWAGQIPLPDPIAEFYRDVGPVNITIEGYGNPTFIPNLSQLWNRQAGYRWNGLTGEPIADWDRDWIVVADEGADPYIYRNGKILFAQHGAGVWEPDEIYPDLNTMAACLATLGAVVLNAGDEFSDDDCYIRPKFRAEAISRLADILGNKNEAEAIVETAGWG